MARSAFSSEISSSSLDLGGSSCSCSKSDRGMVASNLMDSGFACATLFRNFISHRAKLQGSCSKSVAGIFKWEATVRSQNGHPDQNMVRREFSFSLNSDLVRRYFTHLHLIRLQRHWIEDLGVRELGLELLQEPGAGGRVAVGEHDAAGVGLHANSSSSSRSAWPLSSKRSTRWRGPWSSTFTARRETESPSWPRAGAAGGIGIAIADEADGVARVAEQAADAIV
jgi:hypothetical protein